MQPVGADRRPVGGLDEPALDATRSERTPGFQQEQPGVLANRLRSSVPLIAMFGQEAEPRPEDGQIRVPRAGGAGALQQVVPLVEWHDELLVGVEDQPLVAWAAGWVKKLRAEPQGGGPVQAAEPAARPALRPHS